MPQKKTRKRVDKNMGLNIIVCVKAVVEGTWTPGPGARKTNHPEPV